MVLTSALMEILMLSKTVSYLRWIHLALCLGILSCQSHSLQIQTLRVEWQNDLDGKIPENFIVILSDGISEPIRELCPKSDTSSTKLQCLSSGFALSEAPERIHLTVKFRGYHFIHQEVELKDIPFQSGQRRLLLHLIPQTEYTMNDDYATGFTAATGLEQFRQMGYPQIGELGRTYDIKFFIDNINTDPKVY